jgi:hypothetical protein
LLRLNQAIQGFRGEEYEIFMSISDRTKYLEDNPNIEQLVNGFPMTADPTRIMGMHKPDNEFRDLLKTIHKNAGKKSNINSW